MTVFPLVEIDAGDDQIYDVGEGQIINANFPPFGNGFYWTPSEGLSCTDCPNPIAEPMISTVYYLHYTDTNGCQYIDSMFVQVTPSLFVPNAFTPNGDDKNNVFKPIMTNLEFYELFIFDRWGQLILQTTDTEAYWDGTFKGIKCPIDVYVWKINYSSELEPNVIKEVYGHVTLIR
jgi:gliding motility-associated-like protein